MRRQSLLDGQDTATPVSSLNLARSRTWDSIT